MKKTSGSVRHVTRSLFVGAVAGLFLASVFFAGFFLRDVVDIETPAVFASVQDEDEQGYELIDEVDGLLQQHYLRNLPEYQDRQYAAIRGMVSAIGDRNTFFIDPPVARSESDVLAGTYGGIGVSLQRNEAGDFVLYPFEDSPAKAAGIMSGDILLEIGGVTIDLATQQDVVDQMLRGEVKENSGVSLRVRRGEGQSIEFFVEFAVINVPSVLWRPHEADARIGYIQILRFTSRTPEELEQAITELNDADVQAIILDLRDNSGGLLNESILVASYFLQDGVVAYEVTNSSERVFDIDTEVQSTRLPLVVIVNGRTASAAELVAGAIQDQERAILIGQRTFGKGTIQQIFPLSDSSSVHITSAEWLTPDRHAIDGVGLDPDIPMIPDENGRDVEIGESVRYLQALLEQE